MLNPFQNRQPHIVDNSQVRDPQREAFQALLSYANNPAETEREVGIVLPVGCGKSGTITLAPFAFKSRRTLVVAPGVNIAKQLFADFNLSNKQMFYQKCGVLPGGPYPEPVEIRGTQANRGDLDEAHVVITNIQQMQGDNNRWLMGLPSDFFDLILFDEGHHSVAKTWDALKKHFPSARIVNFSATPQRADGQLMAGRVLYSFSMARAIQSGYVKCLKAVQLNPRTLRYVCREDGKEVEVDLDEVRRLAETDADFRRGIVSSTETLNTIVDASIRELERLRSETGEMRLKIIASALNLEHCGQVVEAYRARTLRVDYVHSRENAKANTEIMRKLDHHQLDVIVQVKKLGEGFDHPYLSVAAVFSIFSNLSPFVQFVGRIMRVIVQNAPGHRVNQGVVVFHAGANIARRWADFQTYSEADQAYFDQLLPLEGIDPSDPCAEREITPEPLPVSEVEVKAQSGIQLEDIPLLGKEQIAAIRLLQESGILPHNFIPQRQLQDVPVALAAQRQAMRKRLDTRELNEAARILARRSVNAEGHNLDRQRLNYSNLIVMKSAINRHVNAFVRKPSGQRSEFVREDFDRIDANFADLLATAEREVFGDD